MFPLFTRRLKERARPSFSTQPKVVGITRCRIPKQETRPDGRAPAYSRFYNRKFPTFSVERRVALTLNRLPVRCSGYRLYDRQISFDGCGLKFMCVLYQNHGSRLRMTDGSSSIFINAKIRAPASFGEAPMCQTVLSTMRKRSCDFAVWMSTIGFVVYCCV